MSHRSKTEYLAILKERYQKLTSKKERSLILKEAQVVTGLHKKSLIRALNKKGDRTLPISRQGRPRSYSDPTIKFLKQFYRDSEYQCSVKLKALLPLLIKQCPYELDAFNSGQLQDMSKSSIDRYLGAYRKQDRRRKNSGTRPGSKAFKRLIPLKNLSNIAPGVGTLEADTVAHCGGNMAGTFIWSLTVTDEYSGWTVNKPIFGKSAARVLPKMESAIMSFPFPLKSINVDNGSEFLNDLVYNYFINLAAQNSTIFPMTRSRSYQKNDNARAEQKNWTTVRQLFGYERLDFESLLPLMEEVYELQGLIHNFFNPQLKLKSKVRIQAKITKKYHPALSPYQRVLNDKTVTQDIKNKLTVRFESLNYYDLRKRKEEKLAHFLKELDQLKSSQGQKAA